MKVLADIFNRFYTRYTFSSSHMESTLDEIRGNTAGNSANAEATMENIRSLEQWINLYAGNDNDLRESLLDDVSLSIAASVIPRLDAKRPAMKLSSIKLRN